MMENPKNEHNARKARKRSISKDANDIKRSGTKSISKGRYKQVYAQKKDSINARRRERYQGANKNTINEQRRQQYHEADKDNINEQRRERYQGGDKDTINEQRRERYPEAKDNINEQRRERCPEAKDNINEHRRQRYQEAKDNINEQRRAWRAHPLEMQRLRHECLFRSKADEDITHIKPTSLTTWKWSVNIVTLYVGVPSDLPFVAVGDK